MTAISSHLLIFIFVSFVVLRAYQKRAGTQRSSTPTTHEPPRDIKPPSNCANWHCQRVARVLVDGAACCLRVHLLALRPWELSSDEAVQHVRAEIHFVGPDERSRLGVHLHAPEEIHIFQWGKHAAAANHAASEIEFTLNTIREAQLQTVFIKISNLFDSR